MSEKLGQSGPSYTPYGVGESTSTAIAPASPHQDTSSTTATVLRRSIAEWRCNLRRYMYAKRKWGMSEEFEQSGPSCTPYGVGESTSTAHRSCFAPSGHLFDYSDGTTTIHSRYTRQSSSTYTRQTQMGHERGIGVIRAFLHTIWCRRVDLYSYSSHFDLSGHLYGAIATQPCLSILS